MINKKFKIFNFISLSSYGDWGLGIGDW